ncbi:DUF2087 domain-containing protein [Candidatus Woesearchaeota archaeon]|nr:DUF2087 domain-containing protein [Candidatus Woesearchaeota archaeon]MBW3021780.1 DUF2087 domain-containing protein [Candidatus Woesearchaeota archaeon]
MNDDEFFEQAVKKGDLPKSDVEKQVILKRIMRDFHNDTYYEVDVNALIKKYFEDFALIRRELVNFGYMKKDSYTGKYTVVKRKLSEEDIEKIEKLQGKLKEIK